MIESEEYIVVKEDFLNGDFKLGDVVIVESEVRYHSRGMSFSSVDNLMFYMNRDGYTEYTISQFTLYRINGESYKKGHIYDFLRSVDDMIESRNIDIDNIMGD